MPFRSLAQLALALVALFLAVLSGAVFPLQPLNPLWQLRFIPALINVASLPLIALALLRIGAELTPQDPVLTGRCINYEKLALAAALGFVLLIPVQISASLRLQKNSVAQQSQSITEVETRLAAVRRAVNGARNSQDLYSRMRSLSFVEVVETEMIPPLPQLRQQVEVSLDRMEKQLAQQKANLPSSDPLRLLPELLRTLITLLSLAMGYAAFGRRNENDLSLLDHLLRRMQALSWQRSQIVSRVLSKDGSRGRVETSHSHLAYLQQLQHDENHDQKPGD